MTNKAIADAPGVEDQEATPHYALCFAIVCITVGLHTLRNLILVPYLTIYVLVSLWALLRFIDSGRFGRSVSAGPPVLWLLIIISGTLATISVSGLTVAAYGLSRLIFALPIFLALVAFTRTSKDLRNHIRTMVAVVSVAALSVPLQLLTGPISFLAAESERNELVRYASLVGSLTALGIAVGCYLPLVRCLRPTHQSFAIFAQVGAALISLSKAGIANSVLGLVFLLRGNRKSTIQTVASLAVGAGLTGLFLLYNPDLMFRLRTTLISFGLSDDQATNSDFTASESAVDRLTDLPLANWDSLAGLNSPLVYLIGGGFGMAGRGLVSEKDVLAPITHNQWPEFITVFGIVPGALAIALFLWILKTLFRANREDPHEIHTAVLGATVAWAINSTFANGTVYQPALASIFYLAMFVACRHHAASIVGPHTATAARIPARISNRE